AKHEEAVASYAYLRAAAEEYADNRAQTNAAINKTMDHIDRINKERVGERTSLLKTLNKVFKTLEADSALKEAMQNKVDTNTITSGNITSLIELLRNAKLLEILTQMNSF
ncbi:hypothetical protein Tco_0362591, partial [Tanacetum coccineum]